MALFAPPVSGLQSRGVGYFARENGRTAARNVIYGACKCDVSMCVGSGMWDFSALCGK